VRKKSKVRSAAIRKHVDDKMKVMARGRSSIMGAGCSETRGKFIYSNHSCNEGKSKVTIG